MAYSINPYLPRARAAALKLLVVERLPVAIVAQRVGVHRSTLWRWQQKWRQLNQHVAESCPNRPGRLKHKKVHLNPAYYRWTIPTLSSRPHHNPKTIAETVVRQVLAVRAELKRCAEVVWHHLNHVLSIRISLSSVKRIFKRHHVYDRTNRRPRPYHRSLPRPTVTKPGDLVQTDTIHLVNLASSKRLYVYTVIDLYSRMAYAKAAWQISPSLAAQTVLEAQTAFGFKFAMVQSDNGTEFSRRFEQTLHGQGIQTRHTRLHRPNDNAHIERFNRTIQEECTGRYWRRSVPLPRLQQNIADYLDFYNQERIHLGLQFRTPGEMLRRL